MYSKPIVHTHCSPTGSDEPTDPAWSADDHELYDEWGEWDESGQKARVGWLEWSEVDVLGFTLWFAYVLLFRAFRIDIDFHLCHRACQTLALRVSL